MAAARGSTGLVALGATIGAVLLVGLAAFGLYIDGVVLVYVGVIQPGPATAVAAAYAVLVSGLPILVGRRMRRLGDSWHATVAAAAGLIVAISLGFFPFVVLDLSI